MKILEGSLLFKEDTSKLTQNAQKDPKYWETQHMPYFVDAI